MALHVHQHLFIKQQKCIEAVCAALCCIFSLNANDQVHVTRRMIAKLAPAASGSVTLTTMSWLSR